jgi:hypothetical protein
MHVEPDDLALIALGEGSESDRAHVAGCAACGSEVRSLRAVRDLVSAGGPMPAAPPAGVWDAIEAAVSEPTVAPAPLPGRPHSGDELGERRHRRATRTQSQRRGLSGLGLVAAAAGGAFAMWLGFTLADGDEPLTTDTLVASAELEALDDTVQPAAAEIVERDGKRVLVVDAGDVPDVEDGYLEVWLLAPDASGMVTVGLLEPGQTEFVLPANLSTDDFPVVDVSVEHYDGDPTHSGNSLWRGSILQG